MKQFFLLFCAVQLAIVAVSMAQITFTREWVTGKRSGFGGALNGSPKLRILMHDDNSSICKSLLPAIDYLLEVEKIHQKLCGSGKPYSGKFVRSGGDLNNPEGFEDTSDGVGHLQKSS